MEMPLSFRPWDLRWKRAPCARPAFQVPRGTRRAKRRDARRDGARTRYSMPFCRCFYFMPLRLSSSSVRLPAFLLSSPLPSSSFLWPLLSSSPPRFPLRLWLSLPFFSPLPPTTRLHAFFIKCHYWATATEAEERHTSKASRLSYRLQTHIHTHTQSQFIFHTYS